MIEMAMDTSYVWQPIAIRVLRFNSRQDDVFGFVLIQFVIIVAEPVFEQAHNTGACTFGNVSVDNGLAGIVLFHSVELNF